MRQTGRGRLHNRLFDRVETCSSCRGTIKWASWTKSGAPAVNQGCIAAALARVDFHQLTRFLDRTGDEMHTGMEAGPMLRKGDMKSSAWITAYQRNNALVGLDCGLRGRARSARA